MLKCIWDFSTKVGIAMTNKDKIMEIANHNHGVLLTKQVTDANLPRASLIKMVEEGLLIPIQRGIYVTETGYVDDFYLLQARYPKGIYSHETALYLRGFSDRIPMIPTMTFPYGTSTSRIKGELKPVIISSNHELGRIKIERNGMNLTVYDIERTLVDMLKPRYDTDFKQFIPALKQYAGYAEKNINQLFHYASIFGLEVEMQKYIGGLLWSLKMLRWCVKEYYDEAEIKF